VKRLSVQSFQGVGSYLKTETCELTLLSDVFLSGIAGKKFQRAAN